MTAVLIVLVALAIVTVGVVNIAAGLAKRKENKVLAHTPLAAIERAGDVHRLASRTVRELERLMDDEMVRPMIPAPTQERINKLIREFEDF